VPEVNYLGARCLRDPPKDMNGRIVAVEQARRGYETDLILGKKRFVSASRRVDASLGSSGCR
jgi:hypothetical protein